RSARLARQEVLRYLPLDDVSPQSLLELYLKDDPLSYPRRYRTGGGVQRMDTLRSVYVVAEEGEFAADIRAFLAKALPAGDPLRRLVEPEDLRGEVTAWGEMPHWTVLDALTTADARAFAEVVAAVVAVCPRPALTALGLAVWGKNALVLSCASPV